MIFRNVLFLLIFLAGLGVIANQAQAKSKPNMFMWPSGHEDWEDVKKFQPYLEPGRHSHPSQWATEDWYAEDWIAQRNSGLALVQGYYSSDIIRDQDVDDGAPVLVVGPNFYRLSGLDKRRVVTTIDVVYGVTQRPGAAIVLRDWHTDRPIGFFNREGLILH